MGERAATGTTPPRRQGAARGREERRAPRPTTHEGAAEARKRQQQEKRQGACNSQGAPHALRAAAPAIMHPLQQLPAVQGQFAHLRAGRGPRTFSRNVRAGACEPSARQAPV